jgi:serine/threonine-protein kinase
MDLVGGVVGGRYRVLSRLGEGGMGAVFLARHEILGTKVALKTLSHEHVADPRKAARFAREARLVSRVDHTNVVGVLDFARAPEGFYYLVMEHVDGTTLHDAIARSGAFPPARAAHVLAQIAAGLARAHELGIVHRDLKPENVLLTQRGSDRDHVKIVDFGLAKSSDPSMGPLTADGEVFGTPHFMAPEQWRSQPVSPGTDLYALGVVAYELLTGILPFDGSFVELCQQHCESAPLPPSAHAPRLPPALDRLVLALLAKSPAERPADARAVLEAIGSAWKELVPPRGRMSYAGTGAAPPPAPDDTLPDPTTWEGGDIDVVWDAPTLCDEILRLHAIRSRRADELVDALFRGGPPPDVAERLRKIRALEDEVAARGDQIATVRDRLESEQQADRARHAELRGELVDASLADSVREGALPEEVTIDESLPAPFHPRPEVERRMRAHLERAERAAVEARTDLGTAIAGLRLVEKRLAPLYEQLADQLTEAAAADPSLRRHLVEFGKVDGALATYQALLFAVALD